MKTISNQDSVSAFSVTLDNLGQNSAKSFRIFDADKVLRAINGSQASATSTTLETDNANGSLANTTSATPIVISGFNYQVTTDAGQFSQQFDITRGSIDGRIVKHPNIIAKAKRNTQFDSKLLTIDERFVVDGQTGIDVTVTATEKVTLTFFVEGFLV
tara:strand:+ start:9858 stop:10331 length:474 start_codon:yes stop_codon:yes gene_type:complete